MNKFLEWHKEYTKSWIDWDFYLTVWMTFLKGVMFGIAFGYGMWG